MRSLTACEFAPASPCPPGFTNDLRALYARSSSAADLLLEPLAPMGSKKALSAMLRQCSMRVSMFLECRARHTLYLCVERSSETTAGRAESGRSFGVRPRGEALPPPRGEVLLPPPMLRGETGASRMPLRKDSRCASDRARRVWQQPSVQKASSLRPCYPGPELYSV